jgi:hypothetical protein
MNAAGGQSIVRRKSIKREKLLLMLPPKRRQSPMQNQHQHQLLQNHLQVAVVPDAKPMLRSCSHQIAAAAVSWLQKAEVLRTGRCQSKADCRSRNQRCKVKQRLTDAAKLEADAKAKATQTPVQLSEEATVKADADASASRR